MAEETSGYATLRDLGPLREDVGALKAGHALLSAETRAIREESRAMEREIRASIDNAVGQTRAELLARMKDLEIAGRDDLAKTEGRLLAAIHQVTADLKNVASQANSTEKQTAVLSATPHERAPQKSMMEVLQDTVRTATPVARMMFYVAVIAMFGKQAFPFLTQVLEGKTW